ncbi:hypothetical protein Tco_0083552 [Tanacetum coccineum]
MVLSDPGCDIDEIDAFLDIDVSTDVEDGYHDSEGDIIYFESLLMNNTIPNLPSEVRIWKITRKWSKPANTDMRMEELLKSGSFSKAQPKFYAGQNLVNPLEDKTLKDPQTTYYTVMSDSEDSTVTYTEAPPSPDYVPGPEEPEQAPPLPDFVIEPVYPEFMPSEDEVLPAEEQPVPTDASPTVDPSGYVPGARVVGKLGGSSRALVVKLGRDVDAALRVVGFLYERREWLRDCGRIGG